MISLTVFRFRGSTDPPRPVYRLYEAAVPSNPIPHPQASGPVCQLDYWHGHDWTCHRGDVACPLPIGSAELQGQEWMDTYTSTNPESGSRITSLDCWVDRQATSPGKNDSRHRDPDLSHSAMGASRITGTNSLLGINERVMDQMSIYIDHLGLVGGFNRSSSQWCSV